MLQLTVRNELLLQQQISLQLAQQAQQQQTQLSSSKNQHSLNLMQIAFSTDASASSKVIKIKQALFIIINLCFLKF
jgi:hypothetical protein